MRSSQERRHAHQPRIHASLFIHLFIQPARTYRFLSVHQTLTNQDDMVSVEPSPLFMNFQFCGVEKK